MGMKLNENQISLIIIIEMFKTVGTFRGPF